MNHSQKKFGEPAEGPKKKVRPYMVPWVQEFIGQAPFFIMASSNDKGDCDASPKGGKPGFVKVLDDRHLLIPDVAGNRLFQSYENFESNPNVGLIFLVPAINSTARVNGSVSVLTTGDERFNRLSLEVFSPDENAKILQAILVEVKESYSHCPRALAFSKLWDTERILKNKSESPISRWKPGT